MPKKMKSNKNEANSILIKTDDKTYLNLCFCHMNIGLIFVYIYILASSLSSITTRLLFQEYKFLFNFTLFFLEQSACTIIFLIFQRNIKIDLQTFLNNKYFYIIFSIVYILNVLCVFYGHQLVSNVSMYFTLKKLTPLMLFLNDFFIGKKKISSITILSIFLIVGGSLLVAKDSFSKDYLGYGIVLVSNLLTITYSKLTEIYHKITGYTNLQLLIYNNYLTLPILLVCIFISGEHIKLKNYFISGEDNGCEGRVHSLIFYLFLYCLVCCVLMSSFFISNEKNSSLITKLLSNSRAIFVTVFLHIFNKKKNKLNGTIFIGLVLAIIGSILINVESIFKNVKNSKNTNKRDLQEDNEDKNNKEEEKKTDNEEENKEKNINDEEVMIININNKK